MPKCSNCESLRKPWMNYGRRMQSKAAEVRSGFALITSICLVDDSGNPIFWPRPRVIPLEPQRVQILEKLEQLGMTQNDLTDLLDLLAEKV